MNDVQNNGKQRRLGGRSGAGFKPGQSGNPGGRPKMLAEVHELARQHTRAMIELLVSIAENPDAPTAARVAAAQVILDRAWGRPMQSVDLGTDVKLQIDLGG